MKKFALAAVLTGAASTAFAGGMNEPVMEMDPVVIVEDTESRSSSAGLLLPLVIVAALIAVAAD
ncbi:MAG: hypothetical protein HLUCCA08_02990 [Rhodobacteraceae bacterium HLUCCA08]|nr:MAG: hypothetical protein HLUCCA08_02990 [Rhodobacteraceae bacterium HLUCCA08]